MKLARKATSCRSIALLLTTLALGVTVAGCGGPGASDSGESNSTSESPDQQAVRTAALELLGSRQGFFDPATACRYATETAIDGLRQTAAPDSVDAGSSTNCEMLLTAATLSLDPDQLKEVAKTPVASIVVDGDGAKVKFAGADEANWVKTPTGWKIDSLIGTLPIPAGSDEEGQQ